MTDHIFTEAKTGKFTCLACGAAEAPPHMPAPISVIIDAMDHFISQHEDCKPPVAETVMSDYIKGFDAGCDFIVREIEIWSAKHQYDVIALLAHLQQEGFVPKK
jgi:hypothetical protein